MMIGCFWVSGKYKENGHGKALLRESIIAAKNQGKDGIVTVVETAKKRKLKLQVIKLEAMKKAQSAPTPATIFSLFYNGKFVTTNISARMYSRFDKVVRKRINT
jgi:hypothetical protein